MKRANIHFLQSFKCFCLLTQRNVFSILIKSVAVAFKNILLFSRVLYFFWLNYFRSAKILPK